VGAKRLVLLTRDDFAHRYVANILCATLDIESIIVDRRPIKTNFRRAARQGIGHFISKAARTVFLKAVRDDQARKQAFKNILGETCQAFSKPNIVSLVDGINSPRSVSMVREIDPSAILVFGTSVVRGSVLGLARDVSFNMHTGISPNYRGTGSSFWPVVNGDLHLLGATVHECTDVIDGGVIYEIAHVMYRPGDHLHTLFARTLIAGAEAYGRVVRRYLLGRLSGVPQDLSIGREYRGSELTLGPELKARFRLRKMAFMPPPPRNAES
jgi:methionyl-tRNA formyltransferase